ncbi:unnamed protein product [Brachionus calyciflorus]|uniref:receptor protein serine/threonine kinase n=1 Tax=Brachionus calyciflorus TaxID=104777 RepID=A0A813TEE9_9BILA|nr:unnamed protein product [Brachionus calyciflorus]
MKEHRNITCLHKEAECQSDNCVYEKQCTDPQFSKHCYAIFKKTSLNNSTAKPEILLAGCWSGGDECHSPSFAKEKYENEIDINYKVPDSLLDPSIQNLCISYARPSEDSNYFLKNNKSFCCCANSLCNKEIFVTNERNPAEEYAIRLNPQRNETPIPIIPYSNPKPFTTNINLVLITSLVLMSFLFISLVTFLLFKKKLFSIKNKHSDGIPSMLFTNNLNIDPAISQLGSQLINQSESLCQNNRKDEFSNLNRNINDFKNLTQPLLNAQNESFFSQNIVAPNIDVLPESLLKANPFKLTQNMELVNRNDLKELESFKVRLEEQLAISSSKSSNLSEKITDPNMVLLPSLIQPSDLYLIEKISQGQFSSVWKGKCNNNKDTEGNVPEYGIKIFSAFQKNAWSNEKDIYNSLATTNPYILTHFNSDVHELPKNQGNSSVPFFSNNEFWIILEYHPYGSLNDFLKINLLSWPQMIRLVHSILEGLAYLHSENSDPKKQFAIAHRDLKSKNILVKSDGETCCIADFGLALKLNNHNKLNSAEIRSKVGTRRYMSPELIEGAIAFSKETFLRIDVYACALVLWEIISRGDFYEEKSDYKLPFEDEVGQNPSLEDMKEIVVDKNFRPIIKETWLKHHKISSITQTIEECWDIDLDARISSECAASRIRKIYQNTI